MNVAVVAISNIVSAVIVSEAIYILDEIKRFNITV